MRRSQVLVLLVCGVLTASIASAQDKGRVGLVMGFPTAAAVLWHPTASIGIRPEISISRSSTETTSTPVGGVTQVSTNTNLATSVGVSALFYGAAKDNFRVYVSPRAIYSRTSLHVVNPTGTSDSSIDSYSASGSVGGQYALGRRFGAYGEVGLSFAHSSNPSGSTSTSTNNTIAIRSAVGGILYF